MKTVKIAFGILSFFIGTIFLTGCSFGDPTIDEIYTSLEKVVEAERSFEEQQEPLVDIEKKEKAIYEQIISLGMKEYDQIVKLADEAVGLVEKRKELMNKEEESIQASREEFEAIKMLIPNLENEQLQQDVNQLYDTMMERYDTHGQLYASYMNGVEYDKELYQMLKKEDLTFTDLEKQLEKINEAYKKVLEYNGEFNEQTKLYNEVKLQFYERAEIDVK